MNLYPTKFKTLNKNVVNYKSMLVLIIRNNWFFRPLYFDDIKTKLKFFDFCKGNLEVYYQIYLFHKIFDSNTPGKYDVSKD